MSISNKHLKSKFLTEYDINGRLKREDVAYLMSEQQSFVGYNTRGYRHKQEYLILYQNTLIYWEDLTTGEYYFDTTYVNHGVAGLQNDIRKHLNYASPLEKRMMKTLRETGYDGPGHDLRRLDRRKVQNVKIK